MLDAIEAVVVECDSPDELLHSFEDSSIHYKGEGGALAQALADDGEGAQNGAGFASKPKIQWQVYLAQNMAKVGAPFCELDR